MFTSMDVGTGNGGNFLTSMDAGQGGNSSGSQQEQGKSGNGQLLRASQVQDRGPYDRPLVPRADNVLLCTADVLLCISRGVKAKLDHTIVDSDCGQHSR